MSSEEHVCGCGEGNGCAGTGKLRSARCKCSEGEVRGGPDSVTTESPGEIPVSSRGPIILESPEHAALERLAVLQTKIGAIKAGIAIAEEKAGLPQLRSELATEEQKFKNLLQDVVPKIQFTPDPFLLSMKKKGDSYRVGDLALIRSSRSTRTVRAGDFVASYPEVARRICSIPVGLAERSVGRNNLDPLCDVTTTYSYELEILSKPVVIQISDEEIGYESRI